MVYPKEGYTWITHNEFDLRVRQNPVDQEKDQSSIKDKENPLEIISTELKYVEEGANAPKIATFGPESSPLIMLGSRIEGSVQFVVIKESSGDVVHAESLFIDRPGSGFFKQLNRQTLTPGTYIASISMDPGYISTCTFRVTEREITEKMQDCIKKDGHYCKYDNGIVLDINTGLEWLTGPDKDTNWYEAKEWVDNLKVAGGGFRMPTIKELETLCEKDTGSCNMTPLLKTTGEWVWSGERDNSSFARGFGLGNVGSGERVGWPSVQYSDFGRAFAVRSWR